MQKPRKRQKKKMLQSMATGILVTWCEPPKILLVSQLSTKQGEKMAARRYKLARVAGGRQCC